MSLRTLAPALLLATSAAFAQTTIGLSPGQVISQSVRVVPGERLVLPPGPPTTAITIKGNDITVDFADAYIRGDKDVYHNRENFNGVGVLIEGCTNVTIRNAHVQGFRFNVRVVNSHNVRIENCDVSFSRAIRMMQNGSTLDTFLNLRDNREWRKYGAGILLEGSEDCTVEKCFGTGALIGAALVDCNRCTVDNSDFSFNGGWGVALSHSSGNTVSWNHLDFVDRVWGGGWGGDSAALAVADDSDDNYFVGNSMTHGGDGFFLSNRNDIGPVDPKTGFFAPAGGSDHNIVAYNDGSWSPANAFEGTFSDGNVYFRNTGSFSNYGWWLGFSTNSLLIENTINDNRSDGIAIEQGKGTRIEGNHMERNAGTAIHLWASSQKERKPFPSSGIDVSENLISDSARAFDLTGSSDVAIKNNKIVRAQGTNFTFTGREVPSPLADFQRRPEYAKLQAIVAAKPADFKMYAQVPGPKGLQWLQPDDYGPADFRGDLAAQRRADPGMIELYLLETGVKISVPEWAAFEDTPEDPFLVRIRPKPTAGEAGADKDLEVLLVSKDGKRKQKITGILRTSNWTLKWFSWRGLKYDSEYWAPLWVSKPLRVDVAREIGGDWSYKAPAEGVPNEHFALLATTTIKVPPGRYVFHAISDDGIRIFVDDRPIIDRWNHHGSTADNVPVDLDAGSHTIRVEYCQEDGAAVLRLDWSKQ
jgi:parallel beta-helix repeat protein